MQDQRLYSFFRSQVKEKHFVTTNSDAALKEVMKRLRRSECAIVVICAESFRNLTPLYDEWKKKLYQEKVIKESKVQSISMLPILSDPRGSDPSLLHIDKMMAQENSIVVLKGLHQMHYNSREASYFFQKLKRQTENMTLLSPLVLSTTNNGLFRLIQTDASYRSNTIWLILDEEYQQYVSEEKTEYPFQGSFQQKQGEEKEATFHQEKKSWNVVEKPFPPIQKAYQQASPTETEAHEPTNQQPVTKPEEHAQEYQPSPTKPEEHTQEYQPSPTKPEEHAQEYQPSSTEPEAVRQPEGEAEETITEKQPSDNSEAEDEKKAPVRKQENTDQIRKEHDVPSDPSFSPKNCPSETETIPQTDPMPKAAEQASRIKQEILHLLGCEKKSELFENNLFSNENDAPWYYIDEALFDRETEGLDYIEKKFGVLVRPHIEGKYKRLVCSITMEANGQDVTLSIIYGSHCVNNHQWAAFFVDDYRDFKKWFLKDSIQPLNDKERRDLFAFDEATLSNYYHRDGHPSTAAAIIEIFIDTFCQEKK